MKLEDIVAKIEEEKYNKKKRERPLTLPQIFKMKPLRVRIAKKK
jgi:hypothetical protein